MANWNLKSADGRMLVELTADDVGNVFGRTILDGVAYAVNGGWDASHSLPGRNYSVFAFSGNDGESAPGWISATGIMTGPGSVPQSIDINASTALSCTGALTPYDARLLPA